MAPRRAAPRPASGHSPRSPFLVGHHRDASRSLGHFLHAVTSHQTCRRAIRRHLVGSPSRTPLRAASAREDAAPQNRFREPGVGSRGDKPPSGPCRDTLRTNSAAISRAGSSASASPAYPASLRLPTFSIASAVTAFCSLWFGANTPGLLHGSRRYEDAVCHAGMQVDVVVERRTEAVQKGVAAEPRAGGTRRLPLLFAATIARTAAERQTDLTPPRTPWPSRG